MPSRNTRKFYITDAYYHVYNRGVNKRSIFKDEQDYSVFLNLLKRYLGDREVKDKQGRGYPSYRDKLNLLAFCLMSNHYHLLVYQTDEMAMTKLVQGVSTAYTMYFNRKYNRVGHLFQERFKASMINSDSYLQHISRYIHLNPAEYKSWEFSSLPYYLGDKQASWVQPQQILDLFEGQSYLQFVEDYEGNREVLEALKYELADH